MDKNIIEALKTKFPDYSIKFEDEDSDDNTTIEARKGYMSGFDVSSQADNDELAISFENKLGVFLTIVVFAVTVLLLYFFGDSLLSSIGLFFDTGSSHVTLRIAYIIPALIYFIPLFICSRLLLKILSPKDMGLLASVQEVLQEMGYKSRIEE